MVYEEAESYLLTVPRFAKKNTLEDTKAFLHCLGDPGREKTVIHIAGTNGKGSVCAYLSSVLRRAGYRTGMFTSPHLTTMRERVRISGEPVSEKDFIKYFELVKNKLEQGIPGKDDYRPTFFEMLFFMAMLCFEEENVQVILLETGLGGRLDATNCVDRKDVCIITEIGLDHMEYLGGTIAEIAGEKAGILRKGVPVVYADHRQEASKVIRQKAEMLDCPAFSVSKRDVRNLEFRKNFIDFSFDTRYYGYIRCLLATCAPYQVENAVLALRALDVLSDRLPVSSEALTEGMREMRWEGRMEEICAGVYLDGAHNIDGICGLLDAVGRDGCTGERFLLFSAVEDKQYRQMIGLLTAGRLFDQVFVTEIRNVRGLTAEVLSQAFRAAGAEHVTVYPKADRALEELLDRKRPEDRAYIAGSLYLAGEIKEAVKKREQNDRF